MNWLIQSLEWCAKNWGPVATIALLALVVAALWLFDVDIVELLDRLLLEY